MITSGPGAIVEKLADDLVATIPASCNHGRKFCVPLLNLLSSAPRSADGPAVVDL
jgi:hypothetical protein